MAVKKRRSTRAQRVQIKVRRRRCSGSEGSLAIERRFVYAGPRLGPQVGFDASRRRPRPLSPWCLRQAFSARQRRMCGEEGVGRTEEARAARGRSVACIRDSAAAGTVAVFGSRTYSRCTRRGRGCAHSATHRLPDGSHYISTPTCSLEGWRLTML